MNYRHVQVEKREDDYGYIVGESYLNSIIQKENMIWVPDVFSVENQRWNYENSCWEDFEPNPIPETPITETEQAILDTAINIDYLVCMKELEI